VNNSSYQLYDIHGEPVKCHFVVDYNSDIFWTNGMHCFPPVVCPSVRCPLTSIPRGAISLYSVKRFQRNLA